MMILAACGPAATEEPAAPAEPVATEEPVMTEEPAEPEEPEEPMESVNILLWTQEGEADNAYQFVVSLADAYTAEHPNVTFEVVNKNTEVLREDFQTASLAGSPPDLLWTVNDHAGPFTAAQLIMPVDDMFDLSQYVDSALAAVELEGQHWGVPITNGNQLMLYYNKDFVAEAPANTDEMIEAGVANTDEAAGTYGLVFNQTEPFWLVPWLGGFGGSVFAEDGLTPTLDTPAMVDTLQFLHDLKYENEILPAESDYDVANSLFVEGKAAMIINGDWTLGAYRESFGDSLGLAPIPQVSATGEWPAPYTSGKFFMIPVDLDQAKLDVVQDFITFATNLDNQVAMVETLSRLPALKTAIDNPVVADDAFLAASAEAMTYGTPMPTVLEMRCNWDSMKPEMQAVLADTETPEVAAENMQAAAESCITTLE
jgi:arabinogalactan oligomer/maltooligosaccharide transport system substrate-binding protein